jgi:uncharacterized protein (DUF2236 family)
MERLLGSDITRAIWGDPENVVLVYAGAAAEFALHPENHWLFYTGKLPSDPLVRFRDTLQYQQKLFFMPKDRVPLVARHIKEMHRQVEAKRSGEEGPSRISDQAYFQVFSMLIEYGIRGYEYLNRCLMTRVEKEDYFNDIRSIALMMEIKNFSADYHHYLTHRTQMVVRELQVNAYTRQLMEAYRRNLGALRYGCLLQFQAQFIDPILAQRLGLAPGRFFGWLYRLYPRLRFKAFTEGLLRLALKPESHPLGG